MRIFLHISADNVMKLQLNSGTKEVDAIIWNDMNDLSVKLLKNLDQLARRNGTSLDKIKDWKIISRLPKGYTSERIAKTVFKFIEIAKKY